MRGTSLCLITGVEERYVLVISVVLVICGRLFLKAEAGWEATTYNFTSGSFVLLTRERFHNSLEIKRKVR